MAHTKINTQVIPDGTIVSADLTMPITGFSSTGIDDNATETAITIDSNEKLLIGNTSTGASNTGHIFQQDGLTVHRADNTIPLIIDRHNSDGDILTIRRQGAGLGGISSRGTTAGDLLLWLGSAGLTSDILSGQALLPTSNSASPSDDAVNLGSSSNRFKNLYLGGDITCGNLTSTGIDDNATSTALTIDSSGNVDISGNLTTGNNTDISMGATAPGQLRLDGVGYVGAIALDSTGMYIYHNSGSRSLIFGTNETERLRITSGGNVGIGTPNPSRELQIKLSDDTTTTLGQKGGIGLYAPSNTVGNGGEITWSSGVNSEVWAAISGSILANSAGVASGHLIFATADSAALPTERMRINSVGQVIIGEDASSVTKGLLKIRSDSNNHAISLIEPSGGSENWQLGLDSGGSLLFNNSGSADWTLALQDSGGMVFRDAGTDTLGLEFGQLAHNTASNLGVGIAFSRITSSSTLSAIGITNTSKLTLFSREGIGFFTGGGSGYGATAETVRIDTAGRVLINQTSPDESLNLEVMAPTGFSVGSGFHSGSTQSTISFKDTNTTADYKVRIGSEGDELLLFAGGSERMRIDDTGNVGIGTTIPSFYNKLHVEGGIYTGARGTIHNHYAADIRWIKIFERHYLSTSFNYGQHNILVMQAGATNGHGSTAKIHVTTKQQGTQDLFDVQYVECSGDYYTEVAYLYDATGGDNSAGLLTIWAKTSTTYMQMAVTSDTSGSLGLDKSGNIMAVNTSSATQPAGSTLLTPTLRLETAGSVGIGTSDPDGQLHVKGTKNKTLKLDPTFSSGTYTTLAFARNGVDKWRVFHPADDSYLSFYNEQASSHQLSLRSNGRVGINEVNPAAPLHIEKITETASYTGTSFNSQPTLMLRHTSATGGYNGTRYTNSAGNYEWFTGSVQTGANTADFVFQGYNRTAGAYQEHLRITEEGHLYVGRTSATSAATDHGTQIYNTGVIYQFSAATGNSDIYRWHNGSGTKIGYLQGDGDLFLSGAVKAQGGLQTELGRAHSNVGVTGNNRMPVGHYTPGETVFEIDPTWSASQLQDYFNLTSGACTWVEDSTAPGGYAIKITGNRSVGGNYKSGFPYIPVDQDDIFYMECWIKNTGGGQTGHYMGSIDYSHTFASLGGNPGSFGYWVMVNYTTNSSTGWVKVSGYITGFGNSVGQFESGTKYWTPQALFNYRLDSGTRECYISGWKVIRVHQPGNRTFRNNVTVQGTLSKTSGSFKIDHPLPSMANTHHLVHSFIEGPRADLIYSDTVQLTDGVAAVNIDEYATMTEGTFEALCASVRCFTSNEDTWDAVKGSVTGNILTIECQNVSSNAFVSWMVIGERKDPSMMSTDWTNDSGRVIVEPEKVSDVLNAEYLEAPEPETANID